MLASRLRLAVAVLAASTATGLFVTSLLGPDGTLPLGYWAASVVAAVGGTVLGVEVARSFSRPDFLTTAVCQLFCAGAVLTPAIAAGLVVGAVVDSDYVVSTALAWYGIASGAALVCVSIYLLGNLLWALGGAAVASESR